MFNPFNITANFPILNHVPQGQYPLPPQFHAFMDEVHNHWCVDLTCKRGLIHAYKCCSPLATCIDKLAFTMANANIWVVDEDEKDIPEYEWVKKLFLQPNPLMTGRQMLMINEQYLKLFGESFIVKVENIGLADRPIKNLWVLNPEWMFCFYTPDAKSRLFAANDITEIIDHWEYCQPFTGQRIRLEAEDVLHIKDISLDMSNLHINGIHFESFHRGHSRVIGLESNIENIVVGAKAILGLNVDRGPQGILSPTSVDASGAIPLRKEEKKDLNEQFMNFYGMAPGVSKVIFGNVPLSWQPISYNVKDLMLYEGMAFNAQRIAERYFVPYQLLAHDKGTTFSNVETASRLLYQDAIIPWAMVLEQLLTDFLKIEGGRINFDFSHVAALQESKKDDEESTTIRTNRVISLHGMGLASDDEVRMAAGMSNDFIKQQNDSN